MPCLRDTPAAFSSSIVLGSEFCTSGTVPAVQFLSPQCSSSTFCICALHFLHSWVHYQCAPLSAASLVECSAKIWFLHVWYSTSCAMSVCPRFPSSIVLEVGASLGALPVAHFCLYWRLCAQGAPRSGCRLFYIFLWIDGGFLGCPFRARQSGDRGGSHMRSPPFLLSLPSTAFQSVKTLHTAIVTKPRARQRRVARSACGFWLLD